MHCTLQGIVHSEILERNNKWTRAGHKGEAQIWKKCSYIELEELLELVGEMN